MQGSRHIKKKKKKKKFEIRGGPYYCALEYRFSFGLQGLKTKELQVDFYCCFLQPSARATWLTFW